MLSNLQDWPVALAAMAAHAAAASACYNKFVDTTDEVTTFKVSTLDILTPLRYNSVGTRHGYTGLFSKLAYHLPLRLGANALEAVSRRHDRGAIAGVDS